MENETPQLPAHLGVNAVKTPEQNRVGAVPPGTSPIFLARGLNATMFNRAAGATGGCESRWTGESNWNAGRMRPPSRSASIWMGAVAPMWTPEYPFSITCCRCSACTGSSTSPCTPRV